MLRRDLDTRSAVGTPATRLLTQAGVDFRVHAFEHEGSARNFGIEAASKLGVERKRVFKTLMISVDAELVTAIVPVSAQLDLRALASARGGKKAQLAGVAEAERRTGYVVGGMSPFGQRQPSPVVLDQSAVTYETIFVSAGRRGVDIEINPRDVIMLTNAQVARIARPD